MCARVCVCVLSILKLAEQFLQLWKLQSGPDCRIENFAGRNHLTVIEMDCSVMQWALLGTIRVRKIASSNEMGKNYRWVWAFGPKKKKEKISLFKTEHAVSRACRWHLINTTRGAVCKNFSWWHYLSINTIDRMVNMQRASSKLHSTFDLQNGKGRTWWMKLPKPSWLGGKKFYD